MKARIINQKYPWKIIVEQSLYSLLVKLLKHKYKLEFTVFTYCDREDNEFTLHTPFIPVQTNTAAHTEIEGIDMMNLDLKEGCDLSKLKGHMHSHVNFKVYASATDDKEIISRGEEGGYNASIIMNKNFEVFGHIVDYEKGLYIQDVEVQIGKDEDLDLYDFDRLEEIKMCDNLWSVHNIMTTSYEEQLQEDVDEESVKSVDRIVQTKFKSKYTTFKANQHKKKVGANPNRLPIAGLSNYNDLFDIEEEDFEEDEEMLSLRDQALLDFQINGEEEDIYD